MKTQAVQSTSKHCVKKCASVVASLIGIVAFMAFTFFATPQMNGYASTSSSSNVDIPVTANADSWSAVAQKINDDLNIGVESLNKGDTTTAASAFERAFSMDYVASNFAMVMMKNEPQEAHDLQMQLRSLTSDLFVGDKIHTIPERVHTIEALLINYGKKFDSMHGLKNPRDFAIARAEKTAQERQIIDSHSVRKNEGRGSRSWSDVAQEMIDILDQALAASVNEHDGQKGADLVNKAYYQYYEKLGFEKTVMNAISGARVSQVENQFRETRKAMIANMPAQEITNRVNTLKNMLIVDAKALDGDKGGHVNPLSSFATSAFGQAFVILLREGLEAMLVVAAIISYLAKEGLKKTFKYIYAGVLTGLVASGIMAALLMFVYSSAGSHQEMFEGITALIAMVMLLYTSNWMLSKSSNEAWMHYVDEKTRVGISKGNVFSLAFLAFLAVFREGAETVIFYQALGSMTPDQNYAPLVWGALAATVALIIIFIIFRFTTTKIPYKPFFTVMSVIISVMVVIFAGSGLHELIEADVISGTYMPTWPTNDFLGLYPYVETVAFQTVMAVVVITLFIISLLKRHRALAQQTGKNHAENSSSTSSLVEEKEN